MQPLDNQEIWNTIATSFDHTRTTAWTQVINFLHNAPTKKRFIDLGCGNGRHLLPVAPHYQTAIGLDISINLLKIIAQKLTSTQNNIHLIQGTLTRLPIKSQTITTALCIASLHNIPTRAKRLQALTEINRILTTTGIGLITVWKRNQPRFKNLLKNNHNSQFEEGDITLYWRQDKLNIPRYYHLYTKTELTEDIEQSGLEIQQIDTLNLTQKTPSENFFAYITRG